MLISKYQRRLEADSTFAKLPPEVAEKVNAVLKSQDVQCIKTIQANSYEEAFEVQIALMQSGWSVTSLDSSEDETTWILKVR